MGLVKVKSPTFPNGERTSFSRSLPILSARGFSSSSSRASGLAVTVADLRPEVQHLHSQVTEFVREKVLPIEQELRDFYEQETWTIPAKHQQLQQEAKAAGLWNLFLPLETDPEAEFGAGLTNLEYAHLCEVMGLSLLPPLMQPTSRPALRGMEMSMF